MGGGGGHYHEHGGGGEEHSSQTKSSIEDKEKKAKEKLARQFEEVEYLDDDKTTIFLSHQNRDDQYTQRAHQYADYIEKNSDFKVNIDKDFFPPKQIVNLAEINETISKAMRESDIYVALYHPVKESSRYERSEWYNLEAQKARYWDKPIVHVFLDGSHDSDTVRSANCYKIHYAKGEHWREDLLKRIKIIAKEREIKK